VVRPECGGDAGRPRSMVQDMSITVVEQEDYTLVLANEVK
jgi:hypothetical protein